MAKKYPHYEYEFSAKRVKKCSKSWLCHCATVYSIALSVLWCANTLNVVHFQYQNHLSSGWWIKRYAENVAYCSLEKRYSSCSSLVDGLASFLSPWGFLYRGRGDGKGVAEVPGSSLAGEVGRRPLALYQGGGGGRKPAMRSFNSVFVSQAWGTKDNAVQEIYTRGTAAQVSLIKSKDMASEKRSLPYEYELFQSPGT